MHEIGARHEFCTTPGQQGRSGVGIDVHAGPVTAADRSTGRAIPIWESVVATGWVYVLGETTGADLKIGYTSQPTVTPRLGEIVDGWNGIREYVVLAAVRGTKKDERAIRESFRSVRHGNRTEYIEPDDNAVEYVNWLRSQWFVSADGTDHAPGFPVEDPSAWLPAEGRTRSRPVDDAGKLVQDYDTRTDHLSCTAWSWMVNPVPSVQDYFTPTELIDAARAAMGGVDLDAASHWLANRRHRIPDYFDINRSAFENRWYGRVWLNPPYGDNAPWFREIERYFVSGEIEQLCMLSPVWAFTTSIARPIMKFSSSFVILNPTPKFWGNAKGRTGTNNPHGILYIGSRPAEFNRAFLSHGYPMSFQWGAMDEIRRAA